MYFIKWLPTFLLLAYHPFAADEAQQATRVIISLWKKTRTDLGDIGYRFVLLQWIRMYRRI